MERTKPTDEELMTCIAHRVIGHISLLLVGGMGVVLYWLWTRHRRSA